MYEFHFRRTEGITKDLVKRKALGLIQLIMTKPEKDMVPNYPPFPLRGTLGVFLNPSQNGARTLNSTEYVFGLQKGQQSYPEQAKGSSFV